MTNSRHFWNRKCLSACTCEFNVMDNMKSSMNKKILCDIPPLSKRLKWGIFVRLFDRAKHKRAIHLCPTVLSFTRQYTEAVKSSVGALVGTNGQCAFQVVLELAADRIAKQLPAPRIKAGAMKEEAKALAEEAVKALLPEGVSANVEILAFQSSDTAQEGAIRFCYHLQAGESAAYAERASDTFTRIMEKARKGQRWFRRFWRWRRKQICWKCLFHRAASPVRS